MPLSGDAQEPTEPVARVCSNIRGKLRYAGVGLDVHVVFRRSTASAGHGILCLEGERSATKRQSMKEVKTLLKA
jgi:hypothetical protein